eukprot:TRINITY_DN69352_c0_g1_i1.p1 TRINITY_DN69352_c0_g1~~TRINITY_DN69352_c0_g1_i1.p1  ORF type:complete len:127 (-),score=30.32 TRINITY_DN69352_c0_g1_i1:21-401(-)
MILTHVIVHPESSDYKTLLWNYEEVLDLLHSHAGRTVQMVVSGHMHKGHFHTDELGIHHIVMESPLLSSPGMPGAFLVLEADQKTLTLEGFGNKDSKIFPGVSEGQLGRRELQLRSAGRAHTTSSL